MRSILRSHVKVIELLENIIHENFGWQHVTSKLTSLCLTLIMSSSFLLTFSTVKLLKFLIWPRRNILTCPKLASRYLVD